jgi:hypothetical protein
VSGVPRRWRVRFPSASATSADARRRAVIEAMVAGERDPRVLAALGQGRMRNDKLPALAEALSGMRFGPEHAHAAASLLGAIDLLDAELGDPARAGHRAPGRDPRLLGRGLRRRHRARGSDLGSDWHARHTDRSRKARNVRRQLEALGHDVVITLREDAA